MAASPDSPCRLPRLSFGFFLAGPSSSAAAGRSSKIRTGPFSFFFGGGRLGFVVAGIVLEVDEAGLGRFKVDLGAGRLRRDEVVTGLLALVLGAGEPESESESDP